MSLMRRSLLLSVLVLPSAALAADVVWLTEPASDQHQRVAAQAGSSAGPLSAADLRGAATRETDDDGAAIDALRAAVDSVRAYETKLDGELLIMQELDGPIARTIAQAARALCRGHEAIDRV